ncbi:MAG: hypothetical protein JO006_00420 [Paucibacter sp.]|nr:hypothetical protein [Roseateles sp.]
MKNMPPAWIVYAWPRVLCETHQLPQWQFTHLSTQVLMYGDAEHPALGQTVWQREDELGRAVGVAWDWMGMPEGIVAMVDPLCLITNLQFVSVDGEVLAPLESVRQLNEIVHALPWQDEVQRALALPH